MNEVCTFVYRCVSGDVVTSIVKSVFSVFDLCWVTVVAFLSLFTYLRISRYTSLFDIYAYCCAYLGALEYDSPPSFRNVFLMDNRLMLINFKIFSYFDYIQPFFSLTTKKDPLFAPLNDPSLHSFEAHTTFITY